MPSPSPYSTLKQAVQAQFAHRPTLREVVGQQIFKVLTQHYPLIASSYPELDSAQDFWLITPTMPGAPRPAERLTTVFLEALRQGTELSFAPEQFLSLEPPRQFKAAEVITEAMSASDVLIRLDNMNGAFNRLLDGLAAAFQQAQIDHWNAQGDDTPDDAGITRHRWMQHALRTALLGSMRGLGLTHEANHCLYKLLAGRTAGMQVNALEVTLGNNGDNRSELLPDLLVIQEHNESRLLLWCPPSGKARAYTSFEAFSGDLRDRLAQLHVFDSLNWNRYELQGDAFFEQSGLLLNAMLANVQALPGQAFESVELMEAAVAQRTDPSSVFFEEAYFDAQPTTPQLPTWLEGASSEDRFDYQVAMLDLAIDQGLSAGASSLDGILDLQAYTRRELRAQMLADYPVEANYYSDDLILTLQHVEGVPGGAGVGTGDGVVRRYTMSLTELAIGNLSTLAHASIVAISHRENQLITDWMNASYLRRLVQKVDIGGRYPGYVQQAIGDAGRRDDRVERFGREWRMQLMFDALRLKVDGGLTAEAWQALVEFCRSTADMKASVEIAPLAFSVPHTRSNDTVACMFVIRVRHTNIFLLYRPLYGDAALRQFVGREALMNAVLHDQALQLSVLQWLSDDARGIYEDGGFENPHRFSGWRERAAQFLIPGELAAFEHANRVSLQFEPWLADIDAHLFASKGQVLVMQAERTTVSNAESRWSLLKEGAWLLFNIAAPLLRGPAAGLTWLVLAIDALADDTQALREGTDAQRSLAILDLVGNLSMVLSHGRLPQSVQTEALPQLAAPSAVTRALEVPVVTMGKVHLEGALRARQSDAVVLDSGWGAGPASQIQALRQFVTTVDLKGVTEGADGFYRQGDERYVLLYDEHFHVQVFDGNARIVGPDGKLGPWLWRGERWKVRMGIFGGMPGRRGGRANRQAQFDRLFREVGSNIESGITVAARITQEARQIVDQELKIKQAQDLQQSARANAANALSQADVDRLVAGYEARIESLSAGLSTMRKTAIDAMKQAVIHDKRILQVIPELIELRRYRDVSTAHTDVTFNQSGAMARSALVLNSWKIFDELWRQGNYDELKRLITALHGNRVIDRIDVYRQFREKVAVSVELQKDMIEASIDLDNHLPALAPQTQLIPGEPPFNVQMLLSFRPITTTGLRFHQAMNFLDLGLHLDSPVGGRRLFRYNLELVGNSLKSAASAHAELSTSIVSAPDRIEILQTAWNEYSTALINCMDIIANGGRLVDVGRLEQYREELKALKLQVNEQLLEALAEEAGTPIAARHPAYIVEQSRKHLVRTRSGELVLGTEVNSADGLRLEVRERFTNELLHRFDTSAQGWVEVLDAPTSAAPVADQTAAGERSEQLLTEGAEIERRAQGYLDGDVPGRKLAGLFDSYLDELRAILVELGTVAGSDELVRRLNAGVAEWTARREAMLGELYARTRYPDIDALTFLHGKQLLAFEYDQRVLIRNGTALDKYRIILLAKPGDRKGRPLWEAHLHFARQDALSADFDRGHLKTWEQRLYGVDEAKKLAVEGRRIHRGPITYQQVKDIIPFHAV